MKNQYLVRFFPRLTFLACSIDPPIKLHPEISKTLQKIWEESRKLSYKEIALIILKIERKPMHWRDIANKAEKMNRKETFNSTGLFNALGYHPETFVRVGQGTYALTEWGNRKAENYSELIVKILVKEKTPLSFGVIYEKTCAIRPIKKTSLQMLLDLYVKFYKSENNLYGLREWLPPRSRQTLLTPKSHVEDEKSYGRVKNAKKHGYDISQFELWEVDNEQKP